MLNDGIQIGLLITSALAIYFLTKKEVYIGSLWGLVAQVFWIITSIKTVTWSIGILTLWYIYNYSSVVYNHRKHR